MTAKIAPTLDDMQPMDPAALGLIIRGLINERDVALATLSHMSGQTPNRILGHIRHGLEMEGQVRGQQRYMMGSGDKVVRSPSGTR